VTCLDGDVFAALDVEVSDLDLDPHFFEERFAGWGELLGT
jgi:hypothetical protein